MVQVRVSLEPGEEVKLGVHVSGIKRRCMQTRRPNRLASLSRLASDTKSGSIDL